MNRVIVAVKPPPLKEAPVGVWLWLILILVINALWIGMDLWLYKNGYEMLTTEFKEGLKSKWFGPLIVFLVAGTVAAFCWHMFNTRDS